MTPVPIARRLLAPAPVAIASGTQPKPNASDVITIARRRVFAAASAASRADMPSRTCSIATSQMRIAFLADRPDQRHEPDLEVDVVLEAHRPSEQQRAEHRDRDR